MPPIDVFVDDQFGPEAFVVSRDGRNGIVFGEGLASLTDWELRAVMAHEAAHIINGDADIKSRIIAHALDLPLTIRFVVILCYDYAMEVGADSSAIAYLGILGCDNPIDTIVSAYMKVKSKTDEVQASILNARISRLMALQPPPSKVR
jgi:Zn-dependent protease with chaperone function